MMLNSPSRIHSLLDPARFMRYGTGPGGASGAAPNSAEAQQYFDRLLTPPTPGGTLETLYAAFIDGLVADGVWTLMDQITLFFAGDTEGDTLVNLKNGTWNASRADDAGHSVWTQGQYYDQGAINRAITSNFNPSTASGANFTRNNHGFGVWISDTTQYDSAAFDAGTWVPPFTNPWDIAIVPRWVDGNTYWNAGGSYVTSAGVANSSGFFWVQRVAASGASAAALYRNDTLHASDTSASVALPNKELYCPVKHRTRAFMFGASLTAPQRTALYTRLSTFITAITGGVP